MTAKPRLAIFALTGCSGCQIALVDLKAELLEVLEKVALTKCSTLMDIKEFPEADITLLEGCVASEKDVAAVRQIRNRTGKLIPMGSCACFGGIPGMRNFFPVEAIMRRSFLESESTVDGRIPVGPRLPALIPHVRPVDQVVPVEGYIPGCPPTTTYLRAGLLNLLEGKAPDLSDKNLCSQCGRNHKKMTTTDFEFITETTFAPCELEEIDATLCFLEQGVPCLGLATRAGCEASCLKGNLPCRGCMGPTTDAFDQGAKWVNALASLLPAGSLSLMDDVPGLGYRFTLSMSAKQK